eukprot:CAMPEP_0185573716 /NCGR_PEP_ID=MMETSP0434-20130131/5357_1 /TAXON_ID=626734 ORGANISM="Favella taraikaensis, Strain Fe Narragansett Bay" /NCGR_SAMPLE_ID=MMETSP0434 /ASSEMBLY_ACC=CAM_ASM_000379 /LENGTH=135 /DNA_ID=CAMNT_0028190037 /DNA_START=1843 /DNA_END=2250 /DNA_ORIENTATION=-
MHHFFAIERDHGISNLLEELLRFKFRECAPLPEVVLEVAALAQLKDEVKGVLGALEAQELDDVAVAHPIEHCELLIEKLLHVLLLHHPYLDYFDCHRFFLALTRFFLVTTFVYLTCHPLAQPLIQVHFETADLFD